MEILPVLKLWNAKKCSVYIAPSFSKKVTGHLLWKSVLRSAPRRKNRMIMKSFLLYMYNSLQLYNGRYTLRNIFTAVGYAKIQFFIITVKEIFMIIWLNLLIKIESPMFHVMSGASVFVNNRAFWSWIFLKYILFTETWENCDDLNTNCFAIQCVLRTIWLYFAKQDLNI